MQADPRAVLEGRLDDELVVCMVLAGPHYSVLGKPGWMKLGLCPWGTIWFCMAITCKQITQYDKSLSDQMTQMEGKGTHIVCLEVQGPCITPGSECPDVHRGCGPRIVSLLGREFVIRAPQGRAAPLLCPLLNLLLRDSPFTSTMMPLSVPGPLRVLVLLIKIKI